MVGRYNGVSEASFLVWTESDKLINILGKYHHQEAVIHKHKNVIDYVEIQGEEFVYSNNANLLDITFCSDNAFNDDYSGMECLDGDLYFFINFD